MNKHDIQAWRIQRLAAMVEREGGKAAAGRKLGYRDGAFVGQMLRGERPITEKTVLTAHALSGYAGWFDSPNAGEGQMPPTSVTLIGKPVAVLESGEEPGDAYLQIPEYRVRFAAGNGRTALFDELTDCVPRTYRRDWFVRAGVNPANCKCFKVHGDSMEPMLFDGDSVLVNLAETEISNGKVYAIRYGDELRIKRLYRQLNGTIILHSDNPNHLPRDEELTESQAAAHIAIIGRVRDKSGSGGL